MSSLLLVDTHCHLAWADFDPDREAVVGRARAAGVAGCVLVAVDAASARAVGALADRYAGWGHPTAGIHPTEGAVADPAERAAVAELLASGRFCAVGETGLDGFHRRTSMADQRRSLEWHLDEALERDLPVVLHCRDAFPELIEVLAGRRGAPLRGVLHCFTGGERELAAVLESGLHVGLGGVATFKAREDLRRLARSIPEGRLLLETDAPWLAPVPHRGDRNEPARLTIIAATLAAARGEDVAILAARCSANAAGLFGFALADAS